MSLSFDFSSSTVNEIYIMIWVSNSNFSTVVPAGFDFVSGEYYGASGGYGYAKIKPKSGTTIAWGVGNTGATTATPWGTNSSFTGGYSDDYAVGQFGEAAIDLTALGIDPVLLPGNNPCAPPFTRILFKSRSSSSFTSALQDFAGPYEFLDAPVPSSAIGAVSKLTCLNTSVVLSPQTYMEGNYYKWTTDNGTISGNPESPSITITQPGKYYFQSAAYKGCTSTIDSVIVYKDIYKPKASALVTDILSITIPTVTLFGGDTTTSKYNNANGTYQGLTWAWSGPNSFSSGIQNPVTNKTGVYTLIVTQKSNGCKDTALTNVLDTLTRPLSVDDIIFTAARDDKSKIKITWSVRGESINSFELYRSTDGNTFKSIAVIIPDAAATLKKNNYTDDVSTLSTGNVLYKLKWTDKSGKINYSTIVKVRLGETINIQVMPNPFMDRLNVNFVSDASGNAEVRLISASGNLVKTTASSITKGNNNIQLQDLHSQASGLYIANIIINGRAVASLKVLKQ
jgi:Secretion system C-terminal sorting domain